ncbi:MAG: HAD family hydrolase, partial [Acholeplasmatales bacterium]|nr:HAD family hydrolase [Acholeplasmatales bacterium]
YFKDILGIDNIHAASKVHIGINYMNENNINPDEAAFIGDTLHDYEVANAMGVKCYLVECGHQSREVLEAAGVEVLKNTCDIVERI